MDTALPILILSAVIQVVFSDLGNLRQGYSRITYGHRLDGKTISSFSPVSFLDCVEECLVRRRCLSVSYFKGANYCEIKYEDKLSAETNYEERPGWVYSEKGDWPTDLAGPCSKSTCSINEKCQLASYSAKTEPYTCVISDCGLPDIYGVDPNNTEEGDAIGINRAMNVKCSLQHVQRGSGRLICLSNGTWRYDITCQDKECDEGWSKFKDHCYIRNTTQLNQTDAMSACLLFDAYLVEINDEEENNWIANTLLKNAKCRQKYACTSWTGANDIEKEMEFVWGHSGEKVIYKNWDKDNPDDNPRDVKIRDCVDMFYDGQWNDRNCDHLDAFVCEKDLFH